MSPTPWVGVGLAPSVAEGVLVGVTVFVGETEVVALSVGVAGMIVEVG